MWFLPGGDYCERHTLKDGWKMDRERQGITPPSNRHLYSSLAFIYLFIIFYFLFAFSSPSVFCYLFLHLKMTDSMTGGAGGGFLGAVVVVIDKQKGGRWVLCVSPHLSEMKKQYMNPHSEPLCLWPTAGMTNDTPGMQFTVTFGNVKSQFSECVVIL